MENKRKNFEENYIELLEFCKKENRLPQSRLKEENRLSGFIIRYKDDPRIIEIKEKYSRKGKSFDENLQELVEFCKKENRLPHDSYGKEEDSRLMGFIQRYKKDLRIIEIKEKYFKNKLFNESLQDLLEFCKKENRLPQSRFGKDESRLNGFIRRYKDEPRIMKIKEKYRKRKSSDEKLQDLIEFCEKER